MKHLLSNRWVIRTVRFSVGAIFIYAGVLKIQQPLDFSDSIAAFQLLPDYLINLCALALPPFEIIIGILMAIGWKCRFAAFATLVCSVLFTLILGQALVRGLEVDCGCFGSEEPSVLRTWMSISRAILLMIVSAWLYRIYSAKVAYSHPLH